VFLLRREKFSQAYDDIGKREALLYNDLLFYEYIAYTVKEDNGDKTRIRLRVGDIVDVTEEQEGVAYAQIKAIVLHKYNDGTLYPFFVFDWFSSTSSRHNGLQCTIYRLQGQNDYRWRRVYPLTFVDHNPHTHLRTAKQHDAGKRVYMIN